MNKERPQSRDELILELRTQIQFLLTSCQSFDLGVIPEAKRLSVILRILLHDTSKSSSLLKQLDLKGDFVSYHTKEEQTPGQSRNFIVCSLIGNPVHYYAPNFILVDLKKDVLTFESWWNEVVMLDFEGNAFSRKLIVTTLANQDGGAHVAPTVNELYYKLTRENSQRIFSGKPGLDFSEGFPKQFPKDALVNSPSAVWHTVRQISHEVIESLKFEYYQPKHSYVGNHFNL